MGPIQSISAVLGGGQKRHTSFHTRLAGIFFNSSADGMTMAIAEVGEIDAPALETVPVKGRVGTVIEEM